MGCTYNSRPRPILAYREQVGVGGSYEQDLSQRRYETRLFLEIVERIKRRNSLSALNTTN
jgi:hypothetical protein